MKIKRAMRQIRKSSKRTKKSSISNKKYKGGAIYSFDFNDRIGGLPANISLNGTQDGDCPSTDTKDLGFTNYGLTRGGNRKSHKKSHKKSNKKSHKKSHKKSYKKSHKKSHKK